MTADSCWVMYITNRNKNSAIVYPHFRDTCVGMRRVGISSDVTSNDNMAVRIIRFYSTDKIFLYTPILRGQFHSVVGTTRAVNSLTTTVDSNPFTIDTNHSWWNTRYRDTSSNTPSRNRREKCTALHTTLFACLQMNLGIASRFLLFTICETRRRLITVVPVVRNPNTSTRHVTRTDSNTIPTLRLHLGNNEKAAGSPGDF